MSRPDAIIGGPQVHPSQVAASSLLPRARQLIVTVVTLGRCLGLEFIGPFRNLRPFLDSIEGETPIGSQSEGWNGALLQETVDRRWMHSEELRNFC
jgi:hypothetical protein